MPYPLIILLFMIWCVHESPITFEFNRKLPVQSICNRRKKNMIQHSWGSKSFWLIHMGIILHVTVLILCYYFKQNWMKNCGSCFEKHWIVNYIISSINRFEMHVFKRLNLNLFPILSASQSLRFHKQISPFLWRESRVFVNECVFLFIEFSVAISATALLINIDVNS